MENIQNLYTPICCGVPQGSFLSSLHYSYILYDITKLHLSDQSRLTLYADDILLYKPTTSNISQVKDTNKGVCMLYLCVRVPSNIEHVSCCRRKQDRARTAFERNDRSFRNLRKKSSEVALVSNYTKEESEYFAFTL